MEEERICDKEECDYYPYEKTIKESSNEIIKDISEEILVNLSDYSISLNNIITSCAPWNIKNLTHDEDITINGNAGTIIRLEESDVSINIKCLFCKHFKKLDICELKKVKNARDILSK